MIGERGMGPAEAHVADRSEIIRTSLRKFGGKVYAIGVLVGIIESQARMIDELTRPRRGVGGATMTGQPAYADADVERWCARAKVEALRDLIRYCFDENDAAAVVGGIETVEMYVWDTIAALTGDEADFDAAKIVRHHAAKSYARKVGRAGPTAARADEIEAGR